MPKITNRMTNGTQQCGYAVLNPTVRVYRSDSCRVAASFRTILYSSHPRGAHLHLQGCLACSCSLGTMIWFKGASGSFELVAFPHLHAVCITPSLRPESIWSTGRWGWGQGRNRSGVVVL